MIHLLWLPILFLIVFARWWVLEMGLVNMPMFGKFFFPFLMVVVALFFAAYYVKELCAKRNRDKRKTDLPAVSPPPRHKFWSVSEGHPIGGKPGRSTPTINKRTNTTDEAQKK